MADEKSNDESDVPDYLSDEFLVECIPDIRPGLIHHRAEKRKHEQSKRHEEANKQNKFVNKSRQQIEQEARESALQKEIPADNKGFLLLQKMGYKPGTSLGKGMDGITTPIGVEVKTNRKGLGHNLVIQEKKAKLDELRAKRETEVGDYRQRLQVATAQKEIFRDLRKAQSTCQSLDINHGKNNPVEKWYWPEIPKVDQDECGTDNDQDDKETGATSEDGDCAEITLMEPLEQLQFVVEYLRKTYLYCLWCGINYDSKDDFTISCPGSTKDDH